MSLRILECFRILLQAETDTKSVDGSFKDIINCITSTGDARFAQCFIGHEHTGMDNRSATSALALAAAGSGHLSILQSLVSSYPEEVHLATTSHQSPLYLAAKRGHPGIVKLLLYFFEVREGVRTKFCRP